MNTRFNQFDAVLFRPDPFYLPVTAAVAGMMCGVTWQFPVPRAPAG